MRCYAAAAALGWVVLTSSSSVVRSWSLQRRVGLGPIIDCIELSIRVLSCLMKSCGNAKAYW